MKLELKNLPKGEVEIKIEIPAKDFAGYHDKAFSSVQKSVDIDGFRKGNAPLDAIVRKYGEMIILEEMASMAIREAYIKAVDEKKIVPVSDPQISITKIAKDNPLEFTIVVPILPEVELPNYKKISKDSFKDEENADVKDEDVESVLTDLRKNRAHADHHHHNPNDKDHDHGDLPLPPLNDEFAQSFGDNFKTLDDLKSKIKENLKLEKEQKLREKRRARVLESLIKETKVEVPEKMIENELSSMLAQMKGDILRFGGKWEDYLKSTNKTEDEIKSSWRDDANKRVLSQLILAKISEVEKISPTDEEIETELIRLLTQIQDADEKRARAYIHQALTNEKVLKFLEEGK